MVDASAEKQNIMWRVQRCARHDKSWIDNSESDGFWTCRKKNSKTSGLYCHVTISASCISHFKIERLFPLGPMSISHEWSGFYELLTNHCNVLKHIRVVTMLASIPVRTAHQKIEIAQASREAWWRRGCRGNDVLVEKGADKRGTCWGALVWFDCRRRRRHWWVA